MRAAVYDGGGGVKLASAPDPRVETPDDALVAVTHTAVCGTDLHLLAHPAGLSPGTVLGHEFVGTVTEVGARVGIVRPGDRVVGADYSACGRCRWCRTAGHWHCPERRFFGTGTTFGPALAGAQAERVRVPYADTALRVLPASVPSEPALVLGDTLATGYAAAARLGVPPGGAIAVVGGGPVGQLAALCVQAIGAGPVVVVEPVGSRREVARTSGSIPTAPESARSTVAELTDGRGADGVIDAVGAPAGLAAAVSLVRRGGRVVSVGVPAESNWPMPVADAFERELTIGFAIGDFARDADVLIDLLTSGLVDPGPVLSTGLRLDDVETAYSAMAARTTLKAVLCV